MRLEGTLDAFSLPDIFQLLSYTKKTGTLHLRREASHGAVHLREGAVTGARADVRRQALGRRLVGAGVVDDAALADAVERVMAEPAVGLARALADSGAVPKETLLQLAEEQATDAVFDLLRWPDGEFAFVVDEDNPDDLGATVAVESIVEEGKRRLEVWASSPVPDPSAVITLAPAPDDDPTVTRDEWTLLALVDGRRTFADLVGLSGRGEYVVGSSIASLVERGLLVVGNAAEDDGVGQLVRRNALLAALEGDDVAPASVPGPPEEQEDFADAALAAAGAAPAPSRSRATAPAPVIPERPEPFTPPRQPDHAEPVPAYARASAGAPRAAATVGDVHGATAMQPAPEASLAAPSSYIERDPSVNKSLLLRLIAGVRGL